MITEGTKVFIKNRELYGTVKHVRRKINSDKVLSMRFDIEHDIDGSIIEYQPHEVEVVEYED